MGKTWCAVLIVACSLALARADFDPNNLLPDGRPAQWAFTQGTLNWLAVRANFPNNAHPIIPVEGNLADSLMDTLLFYSDSSWGKLTFNYTFPPIANVTTTATSSTADSIKRESLAIVSALNYTYCEWPCGSPKAKRGNFDAVLVAFYPSPPVVDWAGLGVLGNGFTWTVYPTSAGILEHEIGHNFGMGHGRTTKFRADDIAYNTPDYEGFSRMAAGGAVYHNDPLSRFNSNGHFDPSSKHWFGWIEDEQVVYLSRSGPTPSCPQCVKEWSGKLNAFDRPDVVPGRTNNTSGSPYFAARVAYNANRLVYIYYRTSYPETRVGVSVQFCTRDFLSYLNVGMNSVCWTYDVGGDTATMADSTVAPGTSYVVAPAVAAVELLAPADWANVLPVITVQSVANFSDCPGMICPAGKDISAALSVRFLTDAEIASAPAPDLALAPSPLASYSIALSGGRALVAARDLTQGAKGQGTWTFSLCLPAAAGEATVYVYDSYPYSHLLLGSPPGYQAINAFPFFAVDCCRPGDALDVPGVRVVLVRQLDPQPLAIEEIEVYSAQSPSVNLALRARCWSLPVGGAYYLGDASGRQPFLNDGLYSTYSHSGNVDSGVNHVDMCVLDEAADVARVKVKPRSSWPSRSQNLRLELYALVGSDAGSPSGLRPVGLVWNASLSMPYAGWSADLAVPRNLSRRLVCGESTARNGSTTVSVMQGAAYAIIQVRGGVPGATVVLRSELNSTQCPDGAYLATQATGVKACAPCPPTALSYAEEMSTCASSGQTCSALVLSGNRSANSSQGPSAASAYFGWSRVAGDGFAAFAAPDNASVAWNYSSRAWEVRDWQGGLQGSRASLEPGPFTGPADWSRLGASVGAGGIQAVAVQMNANEILNLCEIEMLDARGVNLLRANGTGAQCYNLPPDGSYQYYNGDRVTGRDSKLNDGCTGNQNLCSCAHGTSGSSSYLVSMMACVLNSSYPVRDVKIYINDVWSSRVKNINLLLFDAIPRGPVTIASFSRPFMRRTGVDLTVAGNRHLTVCYADLAPEPATPSPAALAPTPPSGNLSCASDLSCCERVLTPQNSTVRLSVKEGLALHSIHAWAEADAGDQAAAAAAASAALPTGVADAFRFTVITDLKWEGCSVVGAVPPGPTGGAGVVERRGILCGPGVLRKARRFEVSVRFAAGSPAGGVRVVARVCTAVRGSWDGAVTLTAPAV